MDSDEVAAALALINRLELTEFLTFDMNDDGDWYYARLDVNPEGKKLLIEGLIISDIPQRTVAKTVEQRVARGELIEGPYCGYWHLPSKPLSPGLVAVYELAGEPLPALH